MQDQNNYFSDQGESALDIKFRIMKKKYQNFIDKFMFQQNERYIFTAIIYILYLIRIQIVGGYYVISYILGLFVLHSCIQFFTPLGAPDIDDETCIQELPNNMTDYKNRPLIRNLSEFIFWQYITNSGILSLFLTFFSIFDIPVFWPFLLIYFVFLVLITIHKLIQYRKKLGYNFFEQQKWNKN